MTDNIEWWELRLENLEARELRSDGSQVVMPANKFRLLREFIKAIAKEGERRGIQQGKREAWIELTEFCRQEKDRLFPHSPIQLVWTSIANEMSRIADSLK